LEAMEEMGRGGGREEEREGDAECERAVHPGLSEICGGYDAE